MELVPFLAGATASIGVFCYIGYRISQERDPVKRSALKGALLGPIGVLIAIQNDPSPYCPYCSTCCQPTASICPTCNKAIAAIKLANGHYKMTQPENAIREQATEDEQRRKDNSGDRQRFEQEKIAHQLEDLQAEQDELRRRL